MFVVHIGLAKCGSKALQTFFSQNQEQLRRAGIDYPWLGRGDKTAHHEIAHEAFGRKKPGEALNSISKIVTRSRRTGCKSALISSEALERADAQAVSRFKARLGEQHCMILLFIRELINVIPSNYAQKVRYGIHCYNFDTFYDARIRETRADFFSVAKQWADGFGWENIRVRLVDPDHLVNGNIFDDALAVFSIPEGSEVLSALKQPGKMNVSPGWRVLEAVRALYGNNHDLPEMHTLLKAVKNMPPQRNAAGWQTIGKLAAKLGDSNGWNSDRGRYLTTEQARESAEIYKQAVLALNSHLVNQLPVPREFDEQQFLAREFLPDHTHIPPGELRSFYDELGDMTIKRQCKPSRTRA